jgi:hypothetical protein
MRSSRRTRAPAAIPTDRAPGTSRPADYLIARGGHWPSYGPAVPSVALADRDMTAKPCRAAGRPGRRRTLASGHGPLRTGKRAWSIPARTRSRSARAGGCGIRSRAASLSRSRLSRARARLRSRSPGPSRPMRADSARVHGNPLIGAGSPVLTFRLGCSTSLLPTFNRHAGRCSRCLLTTRDFRTRRFPGMCWQGALRLASQGLRPPLQREQEADSDPARHRTSGDHGLVSGGGLSPDGNHLVHSQQAHRAGDGRLRAE